MSTDIAVINNSRADDLEVVAWSQAVSKQVQRDVAPIWGSTDTFVEFTGDEVPDACDWILRIVDEVTYAGAAGWHSIDSLGRPISEVGINTGLHPATVMSHEVIEVVGNPFVSRRAMDWRTGYDYAHELCDPVQRDSYLINDIPVSAFVTPAWFGVERGQTMMLDVNSSLVATGGPFELRPGGYAVRWDRDGNRDDVRSTALVGHERLDWMLA